MAARPAERALEAVIALTDEVQQAVEAGEWRRAASLDAERKLLLECVLLQGGHLPDAALDALSGVLSRNAECVSKIAAKRAALLAEAAELRRGRDAAAAYESET